MIERITSLRPGGRRDLYGLCSPAKENETHFNYGIGVIIDGETDVSQLDEILGGGCTIWETKPADYAVFQCFGSGGDCIGETWSRFFKEFAPQTGYTQTDGTDFEIYFEKEADGLFCELWVPVQKV